MKSRDGMNSLWESPKFRKAADAALVVQALIGAMLTPAALEAMKSACLSEQTRVTFAISGPLYWACMIVLVAARLFWPKPEAAA